jgi:hypothetical protein
MNFVFLSRNALRLVLVATLGLACLPFSVPAQQNSRSEITFPTTIQWNKQRGVTRYRLQIATDEKFQNVFFDGPLKGERYVVSGFPSGFYYWRVAPADSPSGSYSKPVRFFVSGGVPIPVKLGNRATGVRRHI